MKKIVLSLAALAFLFSCSTDNDNDSTDTDNGSVLSAEAQEFQVDEHLATGTGIGTVVVNGSENKELTFSITSSSDIEINETTGELLVGENTFLDFETSPSNIISVDIFDGATTVASEITVLLNDINEFEALSGDQQELVGYFKTLVLGLSGGQTKNSRWEVPMKLHLQGQFPASYKNALAAVVAEYNLLFTDSDFNISLVETESDSNAQIFFGEKAAVENIWPDMYENIKTGSFAGFAMSSNFNSALSGSRIWVSSEIASLTKHELGHALGFGHSDRCDPEKSFMCATVSANSDFLAIEKEIIRLAYHKDMEKGLTDEEIDFTLSTVLLEE